MGGEVRVLFDCLDIDQKKDGKGADVGRRSISLKDVLFLDSWENDLEFEEQIDKAGNGGASATSITSPLAARPQTTLPVQHRHLKRVTSLPSPPQSAPGRGTSVSMPTAQSAAHLWFRVSDHGEENKYC